jgi:hypothetical protein
MSALSSSVENEEKKVDDVRALKPTLPNFWKASGHLVYNVHTREVGPSHLKRVGPVEETRPLKLSGWQRFIYAWRCWRFAQSANAAKSQPVECAEESAKTK